MGMRTMTTSFTRPADTTAYTAKDVVGPAVTANLTFDRDTQMAGKGGYVVKARLITDQSTNTARYRLHLYREAPTALADNAAYTLLWADREKRVGYIDFDAMTTEGTGSTGAYSQNATVRLPIGDRMADDIYGVLETLDAFTPANAQNYFLAITVDDGR